MDRGLYSAASGGLINIRKIEVVANNLANVNTVGFKAQRIASKQQEFNDTLASRMQDVSGHAAGDQVRTPGAVDYETVTDFSPGPISTTSNPLNVALAKPKQFFVIQTPEGEAYTRAGNFTLNSEGTLVTPDGLPVLGSGGPITISGAPAKITSSGAVLQAGQTIGQVRVVEIDELKKLERTEGVRFKLNKGQARTIDNPNVVPGALEMPNVNAVSSMIELISAQRAFEAYSKTVQEIDTLNGQAIRSAKSN